MRLHKTRSTRDRSIPQLATMSFDEVLMSSGLTFFLFMIQILTCVYQNKKMIFFFFCFPACSQVVQFFKQFVHVSRNTAPPISKHFFVDAIPLLTRWYIYIYIYMYVLCRVIRRIDCLRVPGWKNAIILAVNSSCSSPQANYAQPAKLSDNAHYGVCEGDARTRQHSPSQEARKKNGRRFCDQELTGSIIRRTRNWRIERFINNASGPSTMATASMEKRILPRVRWRVSLRILSKFPKNMRN